MTLSLMFTYVMLHGTYGCNLWSHMDHSALPPFVLGAKQV